MTLSNTLQIQALKTELRKKITFQQMSNTQKKEVIDQLFPEGVAFWYTDPKAISGDKIFGWGDASINGGGFFFGELTATPSGAVTESIIDFRVQM